MKKIIFIGHALVTMLITSTYKANAQGMAVNTTGAAANSSAVLDVSSNTQGVLVPRMTATMVATISNPATGLLVYQTDGTSGFYFNKGTPGSPNWVSLNALTNVTTQGNTFNGPLQLVQANNTGGLPALDGSQVTGLNATNIASGTINAAYLPTTATTQGNTFNGPGQLVQVVSSNQLAAFDGSQLTTLNAGQLTAGTVGTARLGTGTASSSTFLRGDNTWQTISGGSGTVTSVTAGNLTPIFSTNVSNTTTTPNITYTLSNSAAYTVLTNSTNATSAVSYGKVVPLTLFATGGTASSSTFYRGDGSWATPVTPIGYTYTTINTNTTAVAGTAYLFAADGITLTLPSSPATGATIKMIVPRSYTTCKVNTGPHPGINTISLNIFSANTAYTFGSFIEDAATFVYDGVEWYEISQF